MPTGLIGTSDGKQYSNEYDLVVGDHMLDPVSGPFNDQPTTEAQRREGPPKIQILKNQERQMEQDSTITNDYSPPSGLNAPVHEIAQVNPEDTIAHMKDMYIKPIPVEGAGQRMYDKLTGSNDTPRYQTWPERLFTGLADSFDRVFNVSGNNPELKLPSKHGVPGSVAEDDPEGLANLHAITNVAGYMMMGPFNNPIPITTAERALTNLERATPASGRGGASHVETIEAAPLLSNDATEAAMRSIEAALGLSPGEAARYGSTRYAAGLDSLSSSYPRGWSSVEGGATGGGFTQKTITFENKEGQKFYIDAADYGGKNVHVGMVGSMTTDGFKAGINRDFANTIGVSGMRAVLRKVQEEFPNAESISGFRVTGARPVAGQAKMRLKPLAQE